MGFTELALAAFLLFALSVAGLGVGVLFKRGPLSGSCGSVDADGKSLADCLCEKARQQAISAGIPATAEGVCEHEA